MDFFTPYLPIYKNRQANRITRAFFAWYMGIDLDKKRRFIMRIKLTALICFITCLHIYAAGFGQSITLSVKNASLQLVLDKIEKQSGYNLWVQTELLKKGNKVSLDVKNQPLDAVLKDVFKDQSLSYAIVGKTIVVKNRVDEQSSILGNPLMAFINIDGKIVDSKGAPLPGASVRVKGTTKATTTNTEGKFSIVADKTDILVISFVGYKTKEVSLNGQSTLTIQLEDSAAELTEFVVVGYGTTKKVNLTGAISTVSGAVLEDRPIPNIGQGLQGVVPNLTITNSSGKLGATPDFNIRGFNSINGGSPLFVVDGTPLTSPAEVTRLNPQDVESVTVLKDAASAAIYGGRAAFGVVLITTKSGKYNTGVSVQFSSNYSVKKVSQLPEVVTDPATVVKYRNLAYSSYYGTNMGGYTQQMIDYANARSKDPSLPPYYVNPSDPSQYVYVGNTNWFDEFYRKTSPTTDNNLSISGGSDKIKYNFSTGYINQQGILQGKNDEWMRYSMRGKIEFKATEWLKLGNTTQIGKVVNNYPTFWNGTSERGDVYHNIGRIPSLSILKNPNGTWTPDGLAVAYLYDGGRGKNTTNDNLTTFDAQLSFFNNKLRGYASYTLRNTSGNRTDNYIPVFYQTADQTRNIQDGISGIGVGSTQTAQKVLNAYAEYEQTMGKHYLKAMVGIGGERFHNEEYSIFRNSLISPNTPNLQLALDPNSSFRVDPNLTGEYALNSVYSRINYSYDNKYLLELNGRMDATSRFPVNDRVGYFPSLSAGWRISEEGFFAGLKHVIDDAKFRVSYGSLGNQDGTSYYPYIASLASVGKINNILDGTQPPALYAPGLVSPSLTWEKQNSKNLGLDLAMLKNRLNISFDYYIRDVKDMLTVPQQLPAVLGANPPLTNAADLRTKGWEATVSWNDKFTLASSPFSYNFRLVLSDNQTTITKFSNPNGLINDYYVGKKVGEIWGMVGDGFFQSDAEVASHADQSTLAGYGLNVDYRFHAGDPKYVDLNGDGKIDIGKQTLADHGDLKVIGNNTPRYTFGFNASFAWKGFDFSAFLQGVGKRDYWPGDRTGYFWGQYFAPWEQVYQHVIDNTWSPENPDAYFPRFAGWRVGDFGLNAWKDMGVVQTRYILNGAYMRIKNITVGYNLPNKIINKLGVKKIRFYISGENIGEINKIKFKVLDPEALTSSSWGTGKAYPFQRVYSAGLNVTF